MFAKCLKLTDFFYGAFKKCYSPILRNVLKHIVALTGEKELPWKTLLVCIITFLKVDAAL